jgi:hypothetical protein
VHKHDLLLEVHGLDHLGSEGGALFASGPCLARQVQKILLTFRQQLSIRRSKKNAAALGGAALSRRFGLGLLGLLWNKALSR